MNTDQSDRRYLYENIWWRLGFNAVWVVMLVVLVIVLAIIGAVLTKSGMFFSLPNLSQIGWVWLIHALIVAPLVVIVTAGGLDLSVGAVAGLSCMLIAILSNQLNPAVAVLISLGVALLIGLINGFLTGGTRLHGAVVTLAMAVLLRGLTLGLSQGKAVKAEALGWLGSPIFLLILLVLSILLSIGFVLLLARRKSLLDDGPQPWLPRLIFVGVPYVLASLMAGVAGLTYLSRLQMGVFSIGTGLEVEGLLIVFLGGAPWKRAPVGNGIVNIVGALLAALAFAIAQNTLLLLGVDSPVMEVGKGIILLVVALLSYLYYALVARLAAKKQPTPAA